MLLVGVWTLHPLTEGCKHTYTIPFCRNSLAPRSDFHHARHPSSWPAYKSSSKGSIPANRTRRLRQRWSNTRQLTWRTALGGLCSSSHSSILIQQVILVAMLDLENPAYPTPHACTRLYCYRICDSTVSSPGFDINISGGRCTIACWGGIYWCHSRSRRSCDGERPSQDWGVLPWRRRRPKSSRERSNLSSVRL